MIPAISRKFIFQFGYPMKIRNITVEIMSVVIMLIISSVVGYWFYLQSPIKQFLLLRTTVKNNAIQLVQKQNQAVHEKSVNASLTRWKIKHPHFYQMIQSAQTLNQLLQPLSVVIKQSNLVVTDMKLAPNRQKKSRNHIVELKISGEFQNLFALISAINDFQYPVVINKITINQDHLYELELLIRGMHD